MNFLEKIPALSGLFLSENERAIRADPLNIKSWLQLINTMQIQGELTRQAERLVIAHDLTIDGHAVNAFAASISARGGAELRALSRTPRKNIEKSIEVIIKWKTALQCGHSHDVSKGYFVDAEPFMDMQWNSIIFPLIKDFDFTSVVDLACGHGRNTEYLRKLSKSISLVDINQSCIDACQRRFGLEKEGTIFSYFLTEGNSLGMLEDQSITFVYSWDSMVHFDKLIVRDYIRDISRVLVPGGVAFLHHSNYGATSPDSDWANNPGTRSDMSAELMASFAVEFGLTVMSQHIQGRKEGWGQDELDCVSILNRPRRSVV